MGTLVILHKENKNGPTTMNDKDYIIKAENLDYLLSRTVVLNKYRWTGSYKDGSEKAHGLDNCTYIDFQWFSESERLYVRKNRYLCTYKTTDYEVDWINLQRIIDLCRKQGEVIKFKSYEGIYYVINIEDSAYQQLNSNDSAEETVGFANVKLFLNLVAL